ncbi:hypothetical protein [Thalassotalea sp. G2M2-11]|uniref:hypothetical protein n=1 Tax=Thalassotalea sp. G2M2-11 TaxID=2787627 RepID=UPI0019D228AF|nr:hypothetical protein [Thalassotalea sp. G2M2-11]
MSGEAMLIAAGIIAILLGLVHSTLGELVIFNKLRSHSIVPNQGGNILSVRQVRILWASWHLVTLFGWALGIILCSIADADGDILATRIWITNVISLVMLSGAILVLYATKGKHPGWIILTIIAVLSWLA